MTIIIWDLKEKKKICALTGHTKAVRGVICLSSEQILSCSYDNDVRLWDVIGRTCLRVMSGHTDIVLGMVLLSPDHVATSSRDRSIILWQISSGRKVQTLTGHTADINCVVMVVWYHALMMPLFVFGTTRSRRGKEEEEYLY